MRRAEKRPHQLPGAACHQREHREREEVCERDPEGRVAIRHRTVDTLRKLLRGGLISQELHDAGREFERAFAAAGLDPLRALSLDRLPRNRSHPNPSERMCDARQRVHAAMQVLGGHQSCAGSCTWFVLGHGLSLRQWALRQRWGGRPVRPDQATGVLVAALAVLAAHFGYQEAE